MRPNIRISHTLNGRVKDFAADRDLALDEAYQQIIEHGLAAAENENEEIEPEDDRFRSLRTPNTREKLKEELAGSGDLLEDRVDEINKMCLELRDRGEAEKDELLDVVDVDATGYKDRESVWANMVKGKDTLRALPGVEKPPEGKSKWKYRE